MCLYGNDLDESVSPVEAGLTWVIGMPLHPLFRAKANVNQAKIGDPNPQLPFLAVQGSSPKSQMVQHVVESD
jgi:glycine cleavage system aminomethyltransferase T